MRLRRQIRRINWALLLPAAIALCLARPRPAGAQGAGADPRPALPVNHTAADVYHAACATCHGDDGKGAPRERLGNIEPPDFTDCAFASAEADPDWQAVVHEGGPVRGLSRHMPAFGDALPASDIALAVAHVRTFCREPAWPRGDLNFPRAFFTEKAFPENEAVWTMNVTGSGERSIGNAFVYERRFGARNQIELVAPVDFVPADDGTRARGLGDVAVAFKRALFSSMTSGTIAAAGAEMAFPTGREDRGLGNGFGIVEPFAMWGQMLPGNSFLQMHGGIEIPTSVRGDTEPYLRTAIGTTFAQHHGFGRAWSPQVEVLWARPAGSDSEWDVVPQIQVTLSKLQHVIAAGGVRIPANHRGTEGRRTEAVVYLLWDWFDGGFFEFWK